MDAVTRWFYLTRASVLASARWIVLAVSTLLLVMPALGTRADAYMYFANDGTGSVARFDPSNGGGVLDFVSGGRDGVAVNSTYIYWTNEDTFTIGRANLDGTDVDENFITGLLANAVAANDKFIYWTETGAGTDSIGRARIDGTEFDPTFISNLTNAGGIAVDAKHIYWTNGGTTTTNAAIGRANLAGTIVDPTYIPGRPGDGDYNGVAVDSKYVYWTNDRGTGGARGSISRADLGVDDIDLDFITPLRVPFGIAVDATHIYWGNVPADPDGTVRPAIGRANLDGSQADPLAFEYGLGSQYCCALQMAIDALPATCTGTNATIAGTPRSDRLRGTNDDDVIAAGRGDDTVVGLQGDDVVCGGRGDDKLRGQGGDDTLRGGTGRDELRGGGGSNGCRGGKGSDTKSHC